MTSIHRPTRILVHNQAITHNVAHQIKRLPSDCQLFAVVKANGYGHGAVAVAKAAIKGGATGFCVATIDEGIELRTAGFTEPILILGAVEVTLLPILAELGLSFPVASLTWLKQAQHLLQEITIKEPLLMHIKVDTGMGRIGFRSLSEVLAALEIINEETAFCFEGIFTHFSTADQADTDYFEMQNQRFETILAGLPALPAYVHVSNSATALWHPGFKGNMVRYGIAMYGLNPAGKELTLPFTLEPALELVSKLVQVKFVPSGEGIGYGETYITKSGEWIGTVPIGYADGWLRKMQGFSVLVAGNECEIVGRVCMDQIMIRLPQEFPEGTLVTLIGKNDGKEITLQEVADQQETIHYEVACILSSRIPREYID